MTVDKAISEAVTVLGLVASDEAIEMVLRQKALKSFGALTDSLQVLAPMGPIEIPG